MTQSFRTSKLGARCAATWSAAGRLTRCLLQRGQSGATINAHSKERSRGGYERGRNSWNFPKHLKALGGAATTERFSVRKNCFRSLLLHWPRRTPIQELAARRLLLATPRLSRNGALLPFIAPGLGEDYFLNDYAHFWPTMIITFWPRNHVARCSP